MRRGWLLLVVAACCAAAGAASPRASAALIVPAYNSLPGAHAKIYLDFVGDNTPTWGTYSPGVTPAYDTDGNPTDFSAQELENIRQIWMGVVEKYSPFNINVTTVDPGNLNNLETSKIVIGGSGTWAPAGVGGIAIQGSFANAGFVNQAYVFPGHLANGTPKYVAEAAAHEAGHGFGLNHQSQYDANGNLVAEYNPGDADRAPIMGVSYYSRRGLWWKGPSINGASLIQDDLKILSSSGGSLTNNFGYRPDDHGSTLATADPLSLAPDYSLSGYGIIEKNTDADYFSFTTPGGTAHLIADVAPFNPMLDLSMSLFDAGGNLVASEAKPSLGESITAALAPGSYTLGIFSAGGYGDLGQYWLSGSVVPEPGSAAVLLAVALPILARRRARSRSRTGC